MITLRDRKTCSCGTTFFHSSYGDFCSKACLQEFHGKQKDNRKNRIIKNEVQHMGLQQDTIERLQRMYSFEGLKKNLRVASPRKSSSQRPSIPQALKNDVYAYYDHSCASCDISSQEASLDIHHIVPYAQQRVHEFTNLELLCVPCHREKHAHEKHIDILFQKRLKQ